MAGKGVKHSVLQDINSIADDLDDRYPRSSIVRELLQNADDAHATEVHIGVANFLPTADHPLLKGIAFFALNNGKFDEADWDSIRHIGLGTKSGNPYQIGKFGRGLKSVFHLCEAFFYLSHSPSWHDIFNPWSGSDGQGYHPDWDVFSEESKRALLQCLMPLLPHEDWFCIWVPLRRRDHLNDVAPIVFA